jgi:competence protein ComEC
MKKIFNVCLGLVILSLLTLWQLERSALASVYFLDIGQGDAVLIRVAGQNILVDGGPDNLLMYRLGEVLPWWDKKIDYLLISHFHADHYMGFIELLNRYEIKNILVSAHKPEEDFLFSIWQQALAQHDLQPQIVSPGERFDFDIGENVFWKILSADSEHKDFNDNSLVVKFSIGEADLLLTGDLTSVKEELMLKENLDLESELLKVGHHGSRYSSSIEFLQKVKPKICVIQSGLDNNFGHPHPEALQRLGVVNCEVLRNDQLGTIKLVTDGDFWQLE